MPVRPRTADELPPSSRPRSDPDPDRFDWEAMERAKASAFLHEIACDAPIGRSIARAFAFVTSVRS